MSAHGEIDGYPAPRAAGWWRRGRGLRGALVVAAVSLLVVLAAGCGGGGGSPNVANLGSGTTTGSNATAGGSTTGASSSAPPAGSSSAAAGGGARFAIAGGGAKLAQFSACMRTHGVPNFPDPNAQGVISGSSASGLDPSSPAFQKAQQSCAKDLPNGGTPSPAQQAQFRTQALAFSACMRSHGEPNFPDPTFPQGGGARISIHIGQASGIDPHSQQFQQAQQACQKLLPGRLGGPAAAAGGTTGGK